MKVLPFPCTRPAPEVAAEVAAPPYDVFDRDEAAAYVQERPLSFANIDRPETQFPPNQDMYAPEVYARAAELLRERIADGTYLYDAAPCYYLYELKRAGRAQTGIVAVCSVADYEEGRIKRHELTRPDKEQDRVDHIEALGYQTGPIFLAYRDEPVLQFILDAVKTGKPLYRFTDEEDIEQTVWRVHRPESIEAIHAMLERMPSLYIADGHHRTASAVRAAHDLRSKAQAEGTYTGKEPFNYFLSVLFPASQLTILPYNRVVADRAGLSPAELIERVQAAGFEVEEHNGPVEPEQPTVFGLFSAGRWWKLSCSPELLAEAQNAGPVAALDASILQEHLLGPILGIGDPRLDERIAFVGGIRGTVELEERAGSLGVAFTLHATSMDQLMAVADAGLLMPPKSTWFEPKLRSGLFLHRIA